MPAICRPTSPKKRFTDLFAKHGRVRLIDLARYIFSDRCLGFIEMKGHAARTAISALNGHTVRGNSLRVNEERPPWAKRRQKRR